MFTESKITEIYCMQMILQGIFLSTGKIYVNRINNAENNCDTENPYFFSKIFWLSF